MVVGEAKQILLVVLVVAVVEVLGVILAVPEQPDKEIAAEIVLAMAVLKLLEAEAVPMLQEQPVLQDLYRVAVEQENNG
ncbi:MAG: hypothetical protein EBT15_11355 [Betaproteobacteria bacterium]|nr:hypothetical protein [Betaproteobacteria bacterium]